MKNSSMLTEILILIRCCVTVFTSNSVNVMYLNKMTNNCKIRNTQNTRCSIKTWHISMTTGTATGYQIWVYIYPKNQAKLIFTGVTITSECLLNSFYTSQKQISGHAPVYDNNNTVTSAVFIDYSRLPPIIHQVFVITASNTLRYSHFPENGMKCIATRPSFDQIFRGYNFSAQLLLDVPVK